MPPRPTHRNTWYGPTLLPISGSALQVRPKVIARGSHSAGCWFGRGGQEANSPRGNRSKFPPAHPHQVTRPRFRGARVPTQRRRIRFRLVPGPLLFRLRPSGEHRRFSLFILRCSHALGRGSTRALTGRRGDPHHFPLSPQRVRPAKNRSFHESALFGVIAANPAQTLIQY